VTAPIPNFPENGQLFSNLAFPAAILLRLSNKVTISTSLVGQPVGLLP